MTTTTVAPDGRPLVYIRVSTDRQDTDRQELSVPERARADFPGVEPIIIRENEASRKTSAFKNALFERPGSAEAVRLIEEHDIPAIYADHQNRLSRGKLDEWFKFYALCEERGTRIITLASGEIGYDVSGQILSAVTQAVAHEDSQTKVHLSKSGARARAQGGYWVAHNAPYGLRLAPAPDNPKHKVLAETDGFEAVRQAFALVDAGKSIRSAAKDTGINPRTLSNRILRNRHYIGEVHNDGTWYPAKWPAVIDPALFERVQRRLARNAEDYGRHSIHHPFGPILRCHCGARLVRLQAYKEYVYYQCARRCGIRVSAEDLEAAIFAYVGVTPTWIRTALESGEWRILHRSEQDAETIERRLGEKRDELANLVRLAGKGGPVGEQAEREADKLAGEVEQLRADYQRVSRDAATVRADLERLQDALRFGAPADGTLDTHILHWWVGTDVETKRATFDAIFERIELGRDYLRFTFRYGFPGPFAVPFTSHRRSAASAHLRNFGFGKKDALRWTRGNH